MTASAERFVAPLIRMYGTTSDGLLISIQLGIRTIFTLFVAMAIHLNPTAMVSKDMVVVSGRRKLFSTMAIRLTIFSFYVKFYEQF